jgi:DNA polymerase III alpha subunit
VVQGLGEEAAAALLEERRQAPFRSLHDFLVRSKLRRDVLQRLALADAFRCFGFEARQALWECLAFDLQSRPETSGQLSLFSAPILTAAETQQSELSPKPASTTSLDRVQFQPLGGYAQIQADYFTYGLSHRGHPMKELRQLRHDLPPHTSEGLKQLPHNARVKFAGMIIVRQRPPTAKGTAFATLEDESGFIDLILWKKVHEEHRHLFESHSFLKGIGTLQREGTSVGILVQRLEPVFPEETALDAWQEKQVRARSPAR